MAEDTECEDFVGIEGVNTECAKETTAPATGQCYAVTAVPSVSYQCLDDLSANKPHSKNTCRQTVPKVDKYGGVHWGKQGSVGELWANRNGVDKIWYGPGKNGPNSFDWFGWTVPLVTHHDYIFDWD